jgi:hypothetical protein
MEQKILLHNRANARKLFSAGADFISCGFLVTRGWFCAYQIDCIGTVRLSKRPPSRRPFLHSTAYCLGRQGRALRATPEFAGYSVPGTSSQSAGTTCTAPAVGGGAEHALT